jgi:Uma2 family endonuclease
MPLYARERVPHLWVIDPATRTVEIYRLETAGWLVDGTHGGSARVTAEPFGDVELDLRRLWGEA